MKRTVRLASLGISLVLLACNSPSPLEQKKEALKQLKGQLAELKTQIAGLEEEIAALDTSANQGLKSRFVSVEEVTRGTFKHYIEVQGSVEADNNVLATPEQPGVVTGVFVKEGDNVGAGQLLAELENTAIKRSLDEAKTALELAEETYTRTSKLWEQKIGSELQYLQAKTNFETMQQRVKTLEAQLGMTRIEAPVSGTVDAVLLKPGEMASPGMHGVRVVNLKHLKIVAPVADAFVGSVRTGLPVEVSFPDLDLVMQKQVSFVSRVVNPGNRSLSVEVDLSGCDCAIRPNMVGSLRINDVTLDSVVQVPSNLIQNLEDGSYIMAVGTAENGGQMAKKVPVVTGMQYDGTIVVTSGLTEGQQIITAGSSEVVDNQPIEF